MADYKLTRKAVEDLNGIWDYTFTRWTEKQADTYYIMLLNSCQDIANNPDLGKKYDGLSTNIFGLKINRHIIFYQKLTNKPVEIIRILHGRMDLKNKISE